MLLIQSESDDHSTNDVLDWIYYLYPERMPVRINDTMQIGKLSYHISGKTVEADLNIEGVALNTRTPLRRWYRRGHPVLERVPVIHSREDLVLSHEMHDHTKNELRSIYNAIDHLLSQQGNSVNRYGDTVKDKAEQLRWASKAGLVIPDTLFTNCIQDLSEFAEQHNYAIITKANLSNGFRVHVKEADICLSSDTYLLNRSDMLTLQQQYANTTLPLPSLFQQYVAKKFELRVFYLNAACYAMAIFSQANKATAIDYRNYDRERPNRCVPYVLPPEIKAKLIAFMNLMKLNSGSIDMIYTTEGDYVFLEVNPVGQYHWLAKNCNYPIDYEIAVFLNAYSE